MEENKISVFVSGELCGEIQIVYVTPVHIQSRERERGEEGR